MSMHAVTYTISFAPEHYRIEQLTTQVGEQVIPYWAIVSEISRQPIGFSYDENMAKTMCLALELVRAQVYGDKAKAKALLALIDKLKDTPDRDQRPLS